MIFYGGRNIRVTALRDISQRKQIEQELVASESRLTQIAANSRVVIWEVDAKGIFTFVSPVAETVFGFRPDEMVNRMSFLDLYPLDGREETTKKAMEVFERKVEFFNLEGVALSKDDGRLWVSMSGMPILNADGTLKGYRGSSIDITKRKQQALEISNKMEEIKNYQTKLQKLNYTLINAEERERIRFAGFLHDSLGQILSITRIKLTTLLEDHLLNPEAVKSIKESSKLLSEAIHQCRDETYELNPPILKGFGLISALNWKLDHLKEHFSINSTLEANTENLHLKDMLNILLFRITGELINNSIKHANATQINLRIMKNDKEIIISVCDDGKGFMYDPGYSFSQNDSFGLFSISERLRAIGGKLIIDSSPGKGTKASVILSV
jgi:PAS domain S-box-containing protein